MNKESLEKIGRVIAFFATNVIFLLSLYKQNPLTITIALGVLVLCYVAVIQKMYQVTRYLSWVLLLPSSIDIWRVMKEVLPCVLQSGSCRLWWFYFGSIFVMLTLFSLSVR